ncbi:MAG: glycoside hydrolase family 3 protein [Anaerolineae bacterium]
MNNRTRRTRLSRRDFLVKSGQALALVLFTGCSPAVTPTGPQPRAATVTTQPPATASPVDTQAAMPPAKATATLTPDAPLAVKIGQMILVGFRGLTLTEDNPIVRDLRERHIGAVVLFDYDVPSNSPVRNIQSPAQLKALTAALQANATIPLLISVDQEGGQVVRLKEKFGFPPTVSEQYLGAHNDPALTQQNAESMARSLAEAGVNLNLAPVVDLNTNPDNPVIGKLERSFSADPDVVARHALAEIEAHHQYGVLTTLKHFPGHGSSHSDSHRGFVDVTNTWSAVELEPYKRIIAAGECDAIMTAHIFNSKLDPQMPATLSQPIITGILRNELHYDGVVISDDMQMGAISLYYGLETAVLSAIEAGVDMLSIANNLPFFFDPDIAGRVIGIITQQVKDGKLDEARIDQSYQRIRRLKARLH